MNTLYLLTTDLLQCISWPSLWNIQTIDLEELLFSELIPKILDYLAHQN